MNKNNSGKKFCKGCRHFFLPSEFKSLSIGSRKRGYFCEACYAKRLPVPLDVFYVKCKELV